MNWYKKAQRKSRLSELLKGFSAGTILGLIGWMGLAGFADLQNNYVQNPQAVEQKIVEYQNTNPEPEVQQQAQGLNLEEVSDTIARHEGRDNTVYHDTMGIPTIGVGFNLNRSDAREKIEGVGANYDNIRSGRESLTDTQVDSLFQDSLNEAIGTAQRFLPNFSEQPSEVQGVLVNMAFNLGPNRLGGFVNFRTALENNDYSTAADEMIDSQWYGQVGNRSRELVNTMRSIR